MTAGPSRLSPAPAELDRRFYAYVVDRAIGWGLGAAAGSLSGSGSTNTAVGRRLVPSSARSSWSAWSWRAARHERSHARQVRAGHPDPHVDTGRPPGVGRALTRCLLLGAAGLPTAVSAWPPSPGPRRWTGTTGAGPGTTASPGPWSSTYAVSQPTRTTSSPAPEPSSTSPRCGSCPPRRATPARPSTARAPPGSGPVGSAPIDGTLAGRVRHGGEFRGRGHGSGRSRAAAASR